MTSASSRLADRVPKQMPKRDVRADGDNPRASEQAFRSKRPGRARLRCRVRATRAAAPGTTAAGRHSRRAPDAGIPRSAPIAYSQRGDLAWSSSEKKFGNGGNKTPAKRMSGLNLDDGN